MPPTPEARTLQLLRERDADRAIRDAAVSAAHAAYAARWTPVADASLDLAAELAKLDERPPEPEKPKRTRKRGPTDTTALAAERVTELLAMPVPAFADAIRDLSLNPLRQVLIAADARELAAHVATLKREIGGRS